MMTTTNMGAVETITIRGRTFEITEKTGSVYGTLYMLKGPRGASYGTMRNRAAQGQP